ncbi:hypothetical protein chiPu_0005035 [Chiloscyllium punctatum]|uniref:Uncharacterized protein n=1 Tax=Chiloscyllium punctatum TaxID=137246 RepID=A0A401S892_CHIPU|nr:hypothetical protein [Chiloscyllium punctatum]
MSSHKEVISYQAVLVLKGLSDEVTALCEEGPEAEDSAAASQQRGAAPSGQGQAAAQETPEPGDRAVAHRQDGAAPQTAATAAAELVPTARQGLQAQADQVQAQFAGASSARNHRVPEIRGGGGGGTAVPPGHGMPAGPQELAAAPQQVAQAGQGVPIARQSLPVASEGFETAFEAAVKQDVGGDSVSYIGPPAPLHGITLTQQPFIVTCEVTAKKQQVAGP